MKLWFNMTHLWFKYEFHFTLKLTQMNSTLSCRSANSVQDAILMQLRKEKKKF